eukprot:scaffold677959_cov59-Prasinocladus_malaysianus.AAC.1
MQPLHTNSPLEGTKWRASLEGTQAALVDLRLLGVELSIMFLLLYVVRKYATMSDELVISPGSTFGRAAHMWASKHAHVLDLSIDGPPAYERQLRRPAAILGTTAW